MGEPIWLEEDNDSDEEEEVKTMNFAKASQPMWSHNISLNALKTTVHSTTSHLQSLDISGGD